MTFSLNTTILRSQGYAGLTNAIINEQMEKGLARKSVFCVIVEAEDHISTKLNNTHLPKDWRFMLLL